MSLSGRVTLCGALTLDSMTLRADRMRVAAAVAIASAMLIFPQLARADDDAYVDGFIGAFGGMAAFSETSVAGHLGPLAGVALGRYHWQLRPYVEGGASFNIGNAPHSMHLLVESGAAVRLLGGGQLGLGAALIPSQDALELATLFIGARKSLASIPLASGNSYDEPGRAQLEWGFYFRYHMPVAEDGLETFPAAGIFLGISNQ